VTTLLRVLNLFIFTTTTLAAQYKHCKTLICWNVLARSSSTIRCVKHSLHSNLIDF